MTRLIARGPSADPEVLAGLVSACRGCGLLEASAAAHARAIALDRKIRTSVPHTWFLQGHYARVAAVTATGYAYIVSLSMAELGRGAEAIELLREVEPKIPMRIRDLMVAARMMLEGNAGESIAAINRVAASEFRDPEALFYLARQLARLRQPGAAIALLERAIESGFCCLPALERDPWLAPVRPRSAFSTLLRRADASHRAAAHAFEDLRGSQFLGLPDVSADTDGD